MSDPKRDRYLTKLKRLGQLSFEQRLQTLFDAGTCELIDCPDWDAAWQRAVVTARGLVDGREVFAYASNFLIEDGTIGAGEAEAIVQVLEMAAEAKRPVVALLHSTGARVSERHDSLKGNARLFMHVTRLSGVVPQIAACMGLSLGVAAYLAALADFNWMIAGKSYAATTSPAVIKVATGQVTTLDELGGTAMHAGTSGTASFVAADDEACLAGIRTLLGILDRQTASPQPPTIDTAEGIVPAAPYVPYDVRQLIEALTDGNSFLEVHEGWGQSMVTGFARLDGRPVAIVANQSKVRSGAIDVEAARKASRFIQSADSCGLPLVYLVDVPGIMVSPEQEQLGVLSAGGVLFHAVDTDVPRVALVVRKCFGGAFVMLQAKQGGGDRVLAFPTAQIDIAGAEATFTILHGKTYQTHDDAAAFRRETIRELRQAPSDASVALEAGIVDEIIEPARARQALIASLAAIGEPPRRRRGQRRHPNLQV